MITKMKAALLMSAVGTIGVASASAAHATGSLSGKRVAILVAEGFEQPEMTEPRRALDAAGAKTVLISLQKGDVKAWNKTDWGDKFHVDELIDDARADEFDALLLPGGVMNPDKLRMNEKAVALVRKMNAAGKPIAAICHGPWMLVEAGAVRGRTLTSWPSLKTDIENAGGTWTDAQAVSDHGIVTSRKPADIPAFNEKMIALFAADSRKHATR
jgi:protease I